MLRPPAGGGCVKLPERLKANDYKKASHIVEAFFNGEIIRLAKIKIKKSVAIKDHA